MELLQPHLHFLLGIIRSLFQASQNLLILRWAECHVVNLSSFGIRSTSNDTLYEHFIGNIQKDETIGSDTGIGKGFGLCGSAREAVKQPAAFDTVCLVKSVLDLDRDEEMILFDEHEH